MSSDEDEEAVGTKRRNPTRSTRQSKRRQIVDDDEDDDAGESQFDGGDIDEKKESKQPTGKTSPPPLKEDAMKNRLLGRLKKAGDRKRENKDREAERAKKKAEAAAASAKKAEMVIPKKSQSIPRRTPTEKEGSSSLLVDMTMPASSISSNNASRADVFKNKRIDGFTSSAQPPPSTRQMGVSGVYRGGGNKSPVQKRRGAPTPPPPAMQSNSSTPAVNWTPAGQPATEPNSYSRATPPNPNSSQRTDSIPNKAITILQDGVWKSLSELCIKMDELENRPFQLGPGSAGPSVDLSISFLKTKEFDWFDLDSSGEIVLQPKVPIFPEDFPQGKPEWPLAWWGIVDPALGERKDAKVLTSCGRVADPPPRVRQAENEKRGGSKEGEGNDRSRSRRDGNGSRRSRSRSRERQYHNTDHRAGGGSWRDDRSRADGLPSREPYSNHRPNSRGDQFSHPSDHRGPPPEGHWDRSRGHFDGPPPHPGDHRGPRTGYDDRRRHTDDRSRHRDDRGPPRGPAEDWGPPASGHLENHGPPRGDMGDLDRSRYPDDRGPQSRGPPPRGHPGDWHRYSEDRGERPHHRRRHSDERRYDDKGGRYTDDRRNRHGDERRREDRGGSGGGRDMERLAGGGGRDRPRHPDDRRNRRPDDWDSNGPPR